MTFNNLGLSADVLQAVAEEGYTEPTPVQARGIPLVLEGRDVLGAAQTGTGKTAAFALPILERLRGYANTSFSPARHPVRALVLTPTRELAMQVAEFIGVYGRYVELRSGVVYGGVPFEPQARELLGGVEILVATPGRLLDHLGQRTVTLGQVEILVLDEADRMLDMGFLPDIQRILGALPERRQNLLFSATYSDEIRRLSGSLLRDPAIVEVAPRNTAADGVRQILYPVDRHRKVDLLLHLIRRHEIRQALIFTRMKVAASRLARDFERAGVPAVAIHSDRTQTERTRALDGFKSGQVQFLVGTDLASRGLDIEDLPCVINFELPTVPEDYIHRIGRTGRAGATGLAISLACVDEVELLRAIQRLLRRQIPWAVEEGFVPDRNAVPRPIAGVVTGPARGPVGGRAESGRAQDPSGQRHPRRAQPGPGAGAPIGLRQVASSADR